MLRALILFLGFLASCGATFAQRAWLAGVSGRVQVDAEGAWVYLTLDPSGGTRTVYLSAAGPGLTAFGVQGCIADPQIQVWNEAGTPVATNDDRDPALLNDVNFSVVARATKDAGLKLTLAPGQYYIRVSGVNGATGICLIELKDPGVNPTLSSLAVRARADGATTSFGTTLYGVGGVANISLAAFVTGPNLLVTNPLADPALTVWSAGTQVSANSSWSSFFPASVPQTYRSPVTDDFRNAAVGGLWSIGSQVTPNQPPVYQVSNEVGTSNGMFLFELHNRDITTTRPPVAYVTSPDVTVTEGSSLPLKAMIGGDVSRAIWQRNGTDIPGTAPSLVILSASLGFTATLPSVSASDTGTYRLKMTSSAGAVTYSPPVNVKVQAAAPTIVTPPQSATIDAGRLFSLAVNATGGGLSYQWSKNGTAIPGATSSSLTFLSATPADSGTYTVSIANSAGTVVSNPVTLTVNGPNARLTNLSVRATAGTGDRTLIVGFAVEGSTKPLLLRAIGPSLAQYGVASFVPDPRLDVYDGMVAILGNDNWTGSDGRALGAFQLQAGTKDAVVSSAFQGRTYTAQVGTVTNQPGEALVEVYDAALDDTATRLVNLSTRSQLDSGQRLIVGMTLTGTGSKTLVLRAVGPGLSAYGLTTAHSDPRIELYNSAGQKVAENDQWTGDDGHSTGAFPLLAGSKDAVLVSTLSPGGYTLHVLGAGTTSGVVLVEVYESR